MIRNASRTELPTRRFTPPVFRRITWFVAVALGLPILLSAPVEPSARAANPGRPVEALQSPELAALRQRAAEAQRSLTAATAAYEAGKARLAQAVTRALSQRQKAAAARLRVTDGRDRVDALLRSTYKSGAAPSLSLLFTTAGQDADSVLDAATYLGQVTQGGQDVLRDHTVARKAADELQQAAEQAAADATAQERALAAQVAALRTQAAQAQSELEALMRRLVAEQEARERTARLAREHAAREEARRLAAARSLRAADASTGCAGGAGGSAAAWNGYPNGLIPAAALCALSVPGHLLRADAAAGFERLATAYRQALGRSLCLSDSYRSYAEQVRVYRERPSLAAVPGTSNHGWGLAVDLCGGLQSFGTPDQAWMRTNAGRYGWYHPSWAEPGGSRPEPWHWEYGNIS